MTERRREKSPRDAGVVQDHSIRTFLVLTFTFSSVFYALMIVSGHVGGGAGRYATGIMWCPGLDRHVLAREPQPVYPRDLYPAHWRYRTDTVCRRRVWICAAAGDWRDGRVVLAQGVRWRLPLGATTVSMAAKRLASGCSRRRQCCSRRS